MLPASRHKGMLSIEPQRPHRHPLCRTPGAGGSKDNTALCPETLARLSRSLLAAGCPDPAPPPVRAVLAPGGPCILHASPSLRWFDQLGARGRKGTRELSPESSRTATSPGDAVWWPSGLDPGRAGQLVFRSFFRGVLSSACFSPVYRPSPARFFIRGPKGGAL